VAWSDVPFVTLKRWTKLLGNVTMILIVLTEYDAVAAVRQLVARAGFILIPASVLVIACYPEIGEYYRHHEPLQRSTYYAGVATDKNMLGGLCMVLGLGLVSQVVDASRRARHRPGPLLALAALLVMDLWLLYTANAITASACFVLGAALIAISRLAPREWTAPLVPLLVGGMAAAAIFAVALYAAFPDAYALPLDLAGRDMTLTGRVGLWHELLQMDTNPWVGTGFESFFLGARIEHLWRLFVWHPNQAHSGYLETYLTLGLVGLGLLALVLLTAARHAVRRARLEPELGSLLLAYLAIAPAYTLMEAAFKANNPFWILVLLAVAAAPCASRRDVGRTALAALDDRAAAGARAIAAGGAARLPAQVLTWLEGRRARWSGPPVE
jgi:O-antigen ligase